MLTCLEESVTALEDDRSPRRFYTVILLAEAFATKTKAPFSFVHLRRGFRRSDHLSGCWRRRTK